VRAVVDVNVLLSGVLSRSGAPGQILRRWADGAFELIVSPQLLAELERALAYPKIRKRVDERAAAAFMRWVAESANHAADTSEVARRSPDPGDDYLIALAESQHAVLVSGDRHLLSLAGEIPVLTPREFIERLDTTESRGPIE